MKKNVLYMFSLVLYLLITFTILSQKIETEIINAQSSIGESSQTIALLIEQTKNTIVAIDVIGVFICIAVVMSEIAITRKNIILNKNTLPFN